MNIHEAIEVLENYNRWRKGAEIEQPSPIYIGVAIDLVTCKMKDLLSSEKEPEPIDKESPFAYPDDNI